MIVSRVALVVSDALVLIVTWMSSYKAANFLRSDRDTSEYRPFSRLLLVDGKDDAAPQCDAN